MDSKIIAIIVIVLILVAAAGAYFIFGKDKSDALLGTKSYYNISLNFLDKGSQIVTDYKVLIDGLEYTNGTSTSSDFIRLNIPSNGTVEVVNINRDGQKYFKKNEALSVNNTGVGRLSIELDKVGSLEISKNKNLQEM
jgi:hypothetical protein